MTDVQQRIAPVWPLKDYVAVNPFLGYTSDTFLETVWKLSRVRDGEMLMPISHFCRRFQAGAFTSEDIEEAILRSAADYPGIFNDINFTDVTDVLETGFESSAEDALWEGSTDRAFYTAAELLDRKSGTDFQSQIVNEISRHISAYYDQGQAIWACPWKSLPLFQAWRERMRWDLRAEKSGIRGLKSIAEQLPTSPSAAVICLLQALGVRESEAEEFMACQLYSISGWAAFVKYHERREARTGTESEDLIGILAIRLAYDFALINCSELSFVNGVKKIGDAKPGFFAGPEGSKRGNEKRLNLKQMVRIRYVCQVAMEYAYERELTTKLVAGADARSSSPSLGQGDDVELGRVDVQMVFCIDVRSEVMRRNLEQVSDRIETFGFAGFFGLPLEYVPFGQVNGTPQCPVLLEPQFRVHEGIRGAGPSESRSMLGYQKVAEAFQFAWKSFQTAAVSCFSFVESIGIVYGPKLLASSFGQQRLTTANSLTGIPRDKHDRLGPELGLETGNGLDLNAKATLAESILKNLGLTNNFARIVVFCGHASSTTNNPYRAGLDCGACGGHSGEPNARFAALLLNDQQVRDALQSRGITIPEDSIFVPAVHNTTTDEIKFFDLDLVPDTHLAELRNLQEWSRQGAALCRAERAPRLNSRSADELLSRCMDWSEVRPEWGLAGNAAFIVAPRARTAGIKLDGRSFLHNYDQRNDPEFKILELIMTAPMIVANWINLQYYASTVDNRYYGSGNKALHNVVGRFGTLLGNSGDLMTGLPFQSVHNGQDVQHEPLRLLVIIEAPKHAIRAVMEKHKVVDDLVTNGWLKILAIDNGEMHSILERSELSAC